MSSLKSYSTKNVQDFIQIPKQYSQVNNNSIIAKTILKAENKEYELDMTMASKSPYLYAIRNKIGKNEELKIILPIWATIPTLECILNYMKTGKIGLKSCDDNTIQKILWLSDFLQLSQFQMLFIKEDLIPLMTIKNSLTFLIEALKKLKSSTESSDAWYILFDYCMNMTAKNMSWNISNRQKELLEINEKLLEEMIERSFRYQKDLLLYTDQVQLLELLKIIRKTNDVYELLKMQKAILANKKVNQANNHSQLNIAWKIKNILKITEKETKPFVFSGFNWKLEAKISYDEFKKKTLMLYLTYIPVDDIPNANNNTLNINSNTASKPSNYCNQELLTKMTDTQSNELVLNNTPTQEQNHNLNNGHSVNEGIITMSYQIKCNNQLLTNEINFKSLKIGDCITSIVLWKCDQKALESMADKDNDFLFLMNLELSISTMLTHISKTYALPTNPENVNILTSSEIMAILQNLAKTTQAQEYGLDLAGKWLLQDPVDKLLALEMRDIISWDYISLNELARFSQLFTSPNQAILKKGIDAAITKKACSANSCAVSVELQTKTQQNLKTTLESLSSNKDIGNNRAQSLCQFNSSQKAFHMPSASETSATTSNPSIIENTTESKIFRGRQPLKYDIPSNLSMHNLNNSLNGSILNNTTNKSDWYLQPHRSASLNITTPNKIFNKPVLQVVISQLVPQVIPQAAPHMPQFTTQTDQSSSFSERDSHLSHECRKSVNNNTGSNTTYSQTANFSPLSTLPDVQIPSIPATAHKSLNLIFASPDLKSSSAHYKQSLLQEQTTLDTNPNNQILLSATNITEGPLPNQVESIKKTYYQSNVATPIHKNKAASQLLIGSEKNKGGMIVTNSHKLNEVIIPDRCKENDLVIKKNLNTQLIHENNENLGASSADKLILNVRKHANANENSYTFAKPSTKLLNLKPLTPSNMINIPSSSLSLSVQNSSLKEMSTSKKKFLIGIEALRKSYKSLTIKTNDKIITVQNLLKAHKDVLKRETMNEIEFNQFVLPNYQYLFR